MSLEERHNEVFFGRNIKFSDLTQNDFNAIEYIDNAVLISGEDFRTPFGIGQIVNLSTGCKTVINALHYTDRAFNLIECGDNAFTKLAILATNIEIHAFLPFYRELLEDVHVSLNDRKIATSDEFYDEWERLQKGDCDE